MLADVCERQHYCAMPKRSNKTAPKKNITNTVADVVQAVTGAQTGNPPILSVGTNAPKVRAKSAPRKKLGQQTGSRGGKKVGIRGRKA